MDIRVNTAKSQINAATAAKPLFPTRISVKAATGERIELFIDDVKYNGAELVKGKRIALKKVDQDLIFELDGEAFAKVDSFYATEGASLDGQGWQYSELESLKISGDGITAFSGNSIGAQAIQVVASSAAGMSGGVLALGGVGLAAAGARGGGKASGTGTGINGGGTPNSTLQAEALAKIEAYNNGNGITPAALTPADYDNAGVTGVTVNNLAVVNALVLAQAPGGADTALKVQALLNIINQAVDQIVQAAQGNTAASTGLALATFTVAGVTNVAPADLPLIRELLDSISITGASVSNTAQIQALVDAVKKIQSLADGSSNSTVDLSPAALSAVGLGAVINSDAERTLFTDILDNRPSAAADQASEVLALASIADRIAQTAGDPQRLMCRVL